MPKSKSGVKKGKPAQSRYTNAHGWEKNKEKKEKRRQKKLKKAAKTASRRKDVARKRNADKRSARGKSLTNRTPKGTKPRTHL